MKELLIAHCSLLPIRPTRPYSSETRPCLSVLIPGSLLFERAALSKAKALLIEKGVQPEPGAFMSLEKAIKDPFVLEFLNLKDQYSESDLDDALIQNLADFLLELGDKKIPPPNPSEHVTRNGQRETQNSRRETRVALYCPKCVDPSHHRHPSTPLPDGM